MTLQQPSPSTLRLEHSPFGLEHLEEYQHLGHHPVHLQDTFGPEGRYRVIHKLGRGGFATVWLCRDTASPGPPKYVALKIVIASVALEECFELQLDALRNSVKDSSICLALDHFQIQGPNGTHVCFVYPLLGPKVSLGLYDAPQDPDKALKSICFEVVKAVDLLHKHSICHGDLTPNNILHRTQGLDGLAEDAILRILGKPVKNHVLKGSERGHIIPYVPQYLVYPVAWEKVPTKYTSGESCIIDFGQSFYINKPQGENGLPTPYRSPELLLENSITVGIDLWALGCSLFEIRTGRKLFNYFDDDDDEYLNDMVQVLGKMPEPWWSKTWTKRLIFYEDDVDAAGRPIGVGDEEDSGGSYHPSVPHGARSLLGKLRTGVWYVDSTGVHRDITPEEMNVFAELLGSLLQWDPKARWTAKAIMQHAWFKL
ncbi:kinase-like domain-containing protein [Stachybotrys elegans]|uniref:non-specific serine/threonine protein kinase n=1 Tax=Stachybotrys elegans TaxID=80388 RepID=A0A8K0SDU0_9HYPO|nr:kinase-like domain-containing protein [Stachybotrys elegans]